MKHILRAAVLAGLTLPGPALAGSVHDLAPVTVTEWKAVFGRIEARDRVPARARLGGTLVMLAVEEGAQVAQGDVVGRIEDEKLSLRIEAITAQQAALASQLENARTELARGENLLERGTITVQRMDALRTQVDVLENEMEGVKAERQVLEQQIAEGAVLAPIDGLVLNVPVTRGAVVMPGEPVAELGGGGLFLRLAVPERHAAFLEEGAEIEIGRAGERRTGTLAKVYPQIENGRVIADVEVAEMDTGFVDARVLVRLPVDERQVLALPADAVEHRMGLDFVTVQTGDGGGIARTVVLGETHEIDGTRMIEILSGLSAGDKVVIGDE